MVESPSFPPEFMEQRPQEILIRVSGLGMQKTSNGWTLRLDGDSWKRKEGSLQESPISVEKEVSNAEARTAINSIKPYQVVEVNSRTGEINGQTKGLFDKIVTISAIDPILKPKEWYLRGPFTVEHPPLGILVQKGVDQDFKGRAKWSGQEVDIAIYVDEGSVPFSALDAAERIWGKQMAWNERIRNRAVTDLLEGKNSDWMDEGEAKLTPEAFKQRLAITDVILKAGGAFEFWFDAGSLSLGRSIAVYGSVQEGPTDACFVG